jgi:uncharacterized membrane protein
MEYASLMLVHVFFGILWAGGAIAIGLFVVPSVLEAGPGGGAVMGGVLRRRFPTVMTVSSVLVVLSGLRLYMMRFGGAWLLTPNGIALSLGALAGLGAFVIGVFVQRPTAERLGALGAQIAAAGAPPTPEQASELEALRTRLRKVARLTAWHLIAASLLMSGHMLAAVM